MSGFFNMDNALWRGLSRLADLMILNIIFIICSIPIFTIGASLTAMNYVTLKMREGAEGYVIRSFFKSFRQNFKQATGLWLLTLLAGVILAADLMILRSGEGTLCNIMTVIILVLCLIFILVFLYLFAVLSRFENTVVNTIRNSFIMAIADFPRTIAMLAIIIAAIVVSLYNSTTLNWAILFWILVGFAVIAYCNSWFLISVFNKYAPPEEDNEDPDHWDVDETMGTAPKQESADGTDRIPTLDRVENAGQPDSISERS